DEDLERRRPHNFTGMAGFRWAIGTALVSLAALWIGHALGVSGTWSAAPVMHGMAAYGLLSSVRFATLGTATTAALRNPNAPIATSTGWRSEAFQTMQKRGQESALLRWITGMIEWHESFENHALGMFAMLPGLMPLILLARKLTARATPFQPTPLRQNLF